MSDFSILKAAFAGYGLVARRPVSALVWTVFYTFAMTGILALGTYMAGDAFRAMSEMMASGQMDPTAQMQISGPMNLYSLFQTPLNIAASVLMLGAVLRALMRPANPGLAYFRLGGDELRLLVVMIVIVVVITVVMFAGFLLSAILAAVTGISTRAAVDSQVMRIVLLALTGGLASLATMAVVVFLMIKFAFSAAMTVHQRAIRIFESWKLSKGRFWKILVTYLLGLLALAPVAAICLAGIWFSASALGEIDGIRSIFSFISFPPFSFAEFWTPERLIFYVLINVLAVVSTIQMNAIPASIYMQLEDIDAESGQTEDLDDTDWGDEDEAWDDSEWDDEDNAKPSP